MAKGTVEKTYSIFTNDGFLAGYVIAKNPDEAIREALKEWPALRKRKNGLPLTAYKIRF